MVFLVQEVPGRNVIAARQYGEIVPLMPPGDVALSAGPSLRKLQRALLEFSDRDYLLLMGDPVLIGMACMVASDANRGKVRVLKWDRQNHVYYPLELDLNRKVAA